MARRQTQFQDPTESYSQMKDLVKEAKKEKEAEAKRQAQLKHQMNTAARKGEIGVLSRLLQSKPNAEVIGTALCSAAKAAAAESLSLILQEVDQEINIEDCVDE